MHAVTFRRGRSMISGLVHFISNSLMASTGGSTGVLLLDCPVSSTSTLLLISLDTVTSCQCNDRTFVHHTHLNFQAQLHNAFFRRSRLLSPAVSVVLCHSYDTSVSGGLGGVWTHCQWWQTPEPSPQARTAGCDSDISDQRAFSNVCVMFLSSRLPR